MKQFKILPIDIVQGGTFAYDYNPLKKVLSYEIHAVAKKWWVTKRIDQLGKQQVEPAQLLSTKYRVVGQPISFGPLKGKITSVKNGVATAALSVDGVSAAGVGTFSILGKYVELLHLDAQGSAYGFNVHLVMVAA